MNIGQLARQAGVPIDTVRYYERQRLIPEPARSASGYRQYQCDDVTRLNFIRRAKALGFTLEEIGELMAISSNYSNDMNEMRKKASQKLEVVEERLAELTRVRDALHELVDACPGHGALATCPIMAALSTDTATASERAAQS
ncbi:MerR family transcriptional regulator [Luteimonas mephitis]|jgi:Hg(II)-responsive transcriptional regulator|uniref:MerR family transcriptional regulator n=1 Tax=Luteimonas mephitis TaxID=83615 RepID=UPI0003FFC541|nr:MerR family transcriptional regulator [Luteimonas mephitis]